MSATEKQNLEQALKILDEIGLLLVSGSEIPDVCRLVTGQPGKGSWWNNPQAQQIFNLNEAIDHDPDVTIIKLISGKVTFVHRRLWSLVLAVATERGEWQLNKLSANAQSLLTQLDKEKTLISNALSKTSGSKPGDIIRELELKLLLHSAQVHTGTGAHAKFLETWETWARRVAFKPESITPGKARGKLEQLVENINQQYDGHGRLPWQTGTK